MNTIEVSGVSFAYGEKTALKSVTFSVKPKTSTAILGPNGSGKSTLFKILSTLEPNYRGKVLLWDSDLREKASDIRRRVGVVFQSNNSDKWLTVEENLRQQGALYGLRGSELKTSLEKVLSLLKLSERRHDRAKTLSGGFLRRLNMAQALLPQPELLLLDEPTTGLDPVAREELNQFLHEQVHSLGLTIVVSTHILEEAEQCDSVILLDQGQIIAAGSPEELRSQMTGQVLRVQTAAPEKVQHWLASRFDLSSQIFPKQVWGHGPRSREAARELLTEQSLDVDSVTVGQPTLEDFFFVKTGHRFLSAETQR